MCICEYTHVWSVALNSAQLKNHLFYHEICTRICSIITSSDTLNTCFYRLSFLVSKKPLLNFWCSEQDFNVNTISWTAKPKNYTNIMINLNYEQFKIICIKSFIWHIRNHTFVLWMTNSQNCHFYYYLNW